MFEQAFAALSRSAASGSKTTALAPLHMMLALVMAGLLSSIGLNAANWVLILLGGCSAVVVTLEVVAYVYLLLNDRDALRSERFTIEKMRIERGIMGDTASGFKFLADDTSKVLPTSRSESES